MTKDHRLKTRKPITKKNFPLNFLLGCTQMDLSNFELARLGEMADLRKELVLQYHRLMERRFPETFRIAGFVPLACVCI